MTSITLHNVYVEFPMLHVEHRSLRNTILAAATGGRIVARAWQVPVVRALSEISLNLNAGDRIGLVGSNGAGKTTLLRVLAGVYEPVRGTVDCQGRVQSMLDSGLQPEMTGYENIYLRGQLLSLTTKQLQQETEQIAEFTGLGEFMNLPVRVYSTGMGMRLAFAMATIGKPEILLMDEWVLAGDAAFMIKAKARMKQFVSEARLLVLASHSDAIIRQNCSRVIWLHKGQVAADGPTQDVLQQYQVHSSCPPSDK